MKAIFIILLLFLLPIAIKGNYLESGNNEDFPDSLIVAYLNGERIPYSYGVKLVLEHGDSISAIFSREPVKLTIKEFGERAQNGIIIFYVKE